MQPDDERVFQGAEREEEEWGVLRMQLISLFSGCGGLDLGFERAGFEIPVANESIRKYGQPFEQIIRRHI